MIARLPVLLRRSIRIARLVLHIALGILLAGLIFPLLSASTRDRLISRWSRHLLGVLGVQLRADPAPNLTQGALLLCNHISWLDIHVILAARQVHFVAKSEIRDWPLFGWLAVRTRTLFIERARRADTLRINAEMHALIDAGAWVAVFPEGTTSDGLGLRKFLPSLLQPAVTLGCPLIPAALRYCSADGQPSLAPAYTEGVSLWQSLKQIADASGLVAELHFAEPIAPSGHRRELAQQAERAVAALLGIPVPSPVASSADSPR